MSAKPRKPKAEAVVEPAEVAVPVAAEIQPAEIPPCPASDPQYGTKTPAVVAWWFEHFPEEAAVKYAGLTLDR